MNNEIMISEIYGPVLQGEGSDIGKPTTFVRVFGCNMKPECPWCIDKDTNILMEDFTEKPAINVNCGDVVQSPYGTTKIVDKSTKIVQKYIKITLENGKILKCTEDHPLVLHNGSTVNANKLKINDKIMVEL